MRVDDYRFWVRGRIPVWKRHVEPRPRRAVIVLHGLGAAADVQHAELASLALAGFAAVGIDAPHHGHRRDSWLDELGALWEPAAHERFLRLLVEAIPEVSQVIDHLVDEGHWPLGLVGISMGAYTALGVARADARVAATVSLLGSPDWRSTRGPMSDACTQLAASAPVSDPLATARAPLLLINAGRDAEVPPDAARAFAERLRGQRVVEYAEYPESAHLMRPQDWAEGWQRVLEFLRFHLS